MLSFIRKRIILTPTHYVGPKACISHTFIYKWPNVHLLPVPSMLVGWQCLTMQPGKVKFALSFLDLQWHTHSPILGFFSELCYFSLILYLKAGPILWQWLPRLYHLTRSKSAWPELGGTGQVPQGLLHWPLRSKCWTWSFGHLVMTMGCSTMLGRKNVWMKTRASHDNV